MELPSKRTSSDIMPRLVGPYHHSLAWHSQRR